MQWWVLILATPAPLSEANDKAVASFYTQCERLMAKGTIDGYSLSRKPDSATLEMHMGGAVITGTGSTVADALKDIGGALVQKFGGPTPDN